MNNIMCGTWRPMITAPKDGSVIIAIHTDGSGVCAIRWGENQKLNDGTWFQCDYSDEACGDWGGWIPCEQIKQWKDS